ncbi:tyrosine-type recombinase/integrase [Geodermatophilus amargosae]|uniref:tyrosine-type recombinase/integrase n=1 Tax=Geodermatophilus amargosae TaxID=1296565 RepID=UPI0034DF7FDE
MLPGLGELRLREVTVPAIDRLLTTVGGTHGAGAAKSTRGVLSGILGQAVRRGALPSNPVRDTPGRRTRRTAAGPRALLRDPFDTSSDLRHALDRADFDWVTSHVFRKMVATRLDEAGLSARQIADHLGHTRPSLTQDVYLGRGVASPEAAAALQRLR